MKIEAIAQINKSETKCIGDIEILKSTGTQAYVTWKLSSDNQVIASVSENYHINQSTTEESIIKRTIQKIENYRLGRLKIFKSVRVKNSK